MAGIRQNTAICDPPAAPDEITAQLKQRLPASGFAANSWRRPRESQLVIVNVHAARSCLTLRDDGRADWYYTLNCHCNWRKAFHGDPTTLIDTITPILCA
jgi:hypothetical protein